MYLDIDWPKAVGDHLNLLGVRSYAVFTLDAPNKWYFASRKISCVCVLLMVPHKSKILTEVCSVNFHVLLPVDISDMDDHIVKITRCKIWHPS